MTIKRDRVIQLIRHRPFGGGVRGVRDHGEIGCRLLSAAHQGRRDLAVSSVAVRFFCLVPGGGPAVPHVCV